MGLDRLAAVETGCAVEDPLGRLVVHYATAPWLALLRAVEVEHFRTVRRACDPPALDLGCGDGIVASLAFEARIDIGIDKDEASLKQATTRGAYRSVVMANATRLPFADEVFRTVYSNGAMEHMDELDGVLDEVARVMAPGGRLVTLVPSDKFRAPVGTLGTLLGRRVWQAFNRLHDHVNLMSIEEWESRFESHGLGVESVQAYGAQPLASFVSTRDLWSKLHVGASWPFVRLTHGGNLGRLMPAVPAAALRDLLVQDLNSRCGGYWLMVVAQKRSDARRA